MNLGPIPHVHPTVRNLAMMATLSDAALLPRWRENYVTQLIDVLLIIRSKEQA